MYLLTGPPILFDLRDISFLLITLLYGTSSHCIFKLIKSVVSGLISVFLSMASVSCRVPAFQEPTKDLQGGNSVPVLIFTLYSNLKAVLSIIRASHLRKVVTSVRCKNCDEAPRCRSSLSKVDVDNQVPPPINSTDALMYSKIRIRPRKSSGSVRCSTLSNSQL